MNAIDVAVQELLNGVSGDQVKAKLRLTYTTLSSLNSHMSNVRALIYEGNHRHSQYSPEVLQPFADEPGVTTFLNASLKDQVRWKRVHRGKQEWSPGADMALTRLKLLPVSLADFVLTHEESLTLKEQQEAAVVAKNSNTITIPEAGKLLKTVTQMLEAARPTQSINALAIPLLIASGRRETELLNLNRDLSPDPQR